MVFLPFSYPKYETKTVVTLLLIHWLVALGAVSTAYALDCYTFIPNGWICTIESSCSGTCSLVSSVCIILILPASILPIFLYVMLFIKAHKAKKAMAQVPGNSDGAKKDWKATITFFLMFITVFAMTLPGLIVVSVASVIYGEEDLPLALYIVSVISTRLISFQPVTDPIFILRNRDVREVITEMKEKVVQKLRQPTCG